MPVDPGLAAVVVGSAVMAALLAAGLLLLPRGQNSRRGGAFLAPEEGISFLFDGTAMVDATPEARALLAGPSLRGPPWDRLRAVLAPRFPALDGALARLPADGQVTLTSHAAEGGHRQVLRVELVGGLTRVRLASPETGAETGLATSFDSYCALVDELAGLREVMAEAPHPIWREDATGTIWANAAYLRLAGEVLDEGEELAWPLPRLFQPRTSGTAGGPHRQGLASRSKAAMRWFDVVQHGEGDERLCFALPADAAHRAEAGLRDFMQTLVLTFAHLPVGLAIFDGQKELHLFNPAFMDLTGLPVDFLTGRPRLATVLDALRDRSMIPEPKDYRGWRKRLAEMERTGAGAVHDETWSLPGGQTYRVSARPHGDGGLAVMIEDISTEMTRTRRYRADLELGQAVIDAMAEGIAVFSSAGHLVMSNEAYGALWGQDLSQRLVDAGILSLARHWKDLSPPSPIWQQIEEFVAATGERMAWTAELRLLDGRLLACRVAPLAGGATLVAFRALVPGEAARSPKAGSVARLSAR